MLDGWSLFTVSYPWRSHVSLSSLRATGKKKKKCYLISFLLSCAADGEKVHAGSQRGAARRALPPSAALIHFCCTLCQIQSNPFLHRIRRSSLSELEVANLDPLTLIIAYEKYCQTAYYSRVTTSHSAGANKPTVGLSLSSLFSTVTSSALFYQTSRPKEFWETFPLAVTGLFIMFNLPNNTHLAE